MAKTLFDHIKGVTKEKVKWETLGEDDRKSWNNFIVTRWLSMDQELIEVVNEIQKYSNGILQPSDYYKLLYDFLPKMTFYLKYTKKKSKIEIDKKFIDLLSNYFQVSKKDVYDYIRDLVRLNPDELIGILSAHGMMKEEIELFKKQLKTIK